MPSYKLHIIADIWSDHEISDSDLDAINECLKEMLQHGGSLEQELPYFIEGADTITVNRLTASKLDR